MFSEIITSVQSMSSTTLTIFFALCGVVYFIYLKPTIQRSQELHKLQSDKFNQIPTPEDISKMMDAAVNIMTTSFKNNNVSILDALDKKINEIQTSVNALTQDFQSHVDEENLRNNQQSEIMFDLFSNSKSIEALIEHLLIELAKSETIPPIDIHQLNELKNRVVDTKMNLNLMMAMFNRHMNITDTKKQSKLNRVMQTRV